MARCTWTDIAAAGQTPSAMARSHSLTSLLEAHAKSPGVLQVSIADEAIHRLERAVDVLREHATYMQSLTVQL